MLGGYIDVAEAYMEDEMIQNGGEDQQTPLPTEYLPKFPGPDPWHKNSSCSEDFLMIAEFSEQEGPKPVVTIPDDLSSRMDLNDFSVKIMSVDFQTMASEKFSVSEDTQVVISQSQHKIHAYIHHFTLYDSQARGFVRPFCMTYVTPDNSKIMGLYEDLASEFSHVAQLFKYSNLELFVNDMTHYLTDLQYTKQRYKENELTGGGEGGTGGAEGGGGEEEGKEEDAVILQSVTLPGLNAAIEEVKNIIDTTTLMLNDKTWESLRFRIEKLRLRQQGALVSPDNEENTTLSFDHFSRSLSVTHAVPEHPVLSSPKHRAGSCSDLTSLGKTRHSSGYSDCVYVPKLVRTSNKQRFDKFLRSLEDLCPVGAEEGKKKLNTIYKYFCRDMATLLVERKDSKLMEPNSGLLSIGSNVQLNMLTNLHLVGLPTAAMKASESLLSGRWDDSCSFQSAESFLSCQDDLFEDRESLGSYDIISCDNSTVEVAKEQAAQQENRSTGTALSNLNVGGSKPAGSNGGGSGGSGGVSGKVKLFSSTDHLHSMGPGVPGYGIRKVVADFAFAPHLLYALLCGRLVVVMGTTKLEKHVRAIVTALSMFIPGHSSGSVENWRQNSGLKLLDLGTLKLIGLCCPDKKSLDQFIPTHIRKHITVFDVERRILLTPGYQGGIVTDICNKHKCFTANTAYVAYIHSVLLELSSKAFIYFHAFCVTAQQSKSHTELPTRTFHREQQAFFTKLKVGADDSQIIQYLVDVIVREQLNEFSAPEDSPELQCQSITLSNRKCGMFKV